ncbi:MAG: tetratricopeptide repeat protein, partial [Bacteroidaceae bacterium]|nr:tetratricopeptide repeat protein [Bacteroidaceae bacterium]
MPAAATATDTAATFTVGVLTKEAADSAYAAEDYARAASLYAALIAANGESPEIYFNLGNAYYRQDSLAR